MCPSLATFEPTDQFSWNLVQMLSYFTDTNLHHHGSRADLWGIRNQRVLNFVGQYVNFVVTFSKMKNENLVTTFTTFLLYGDYWWTVAVRHLKCHIFICYKNVYIVCMKYFIVCGKYWYGSDMNLWYYVCKLPSTFFFTYYTDNQAFLAVQSI